MLHVIFLLTEIMCMVIYHAMESEDIMRLPSIDLLMANIREALVVKAEELSLMAGGARGEQLIELVTGVPGVSQLPTDWFADQTALEQIDPHRHEITRRVLELRTLLLARSCGGKPDDGALDSDLMDQEYVQHIELFLSSLPEMMLGGQDWSGCRNGAVHDLLITGRAWQRLLASIDEGTKGEFGIEYLTATDLALVAGIDVRTMRNQVGPSRALRTIAQYREKRTSVQDRGFAAINRFDAVPWLFGRKDFRIASLKPGLFANRLSDIDDDLARGRSALLAAFVLGMRPDGLAKAMNAGPDAITALGDGVAEGDLPTRLADHVSHFDRSRTLGSS